ncbi:MAG TPA: FtsX-like permease family protein [Anaerolineales bacterium]|nr:FtsX-like permease family protein [Anaerolineales bacterium]
MYLKNLLRRKTRTFLTVIGIAIGVAAIIALGALAEGLEAGYRSILTGNKADLVLSQPDSFDIAYSSIEETVGDQLASAPEVKEISGMLQGFSQVENEPIFFIFGYPEDSFLLERFEISSGEGLGSRQTQRAQGRPILLGSAAAEVLDKKVGDSLRLTGSVYRVAGIYQTGDAFEDSGAVLSLKDAQILLGKPRQVNVLYIRLKDPTLKERLTARIERQYPDLALSGLQEFADSQAIVDMMKGYVWAIGSLAILIGGIGMMNSQLMSVLERTREIGVLRALGWTQKRVLSMILIETISVSLLGGILGLGLGYLMLYSLAQITVLMGVGAVSVSYALMIQAFLVVILLGTVGGLYPAWRASRLQPIEALRYEGGSSQPIRRLPIGGMAIQSLWQRSGRTILTLSAISLTVGSIMALEGILRGSADAMNTMFVDTNVEIMVRQANIADTSTSAIDERLVGKLSSMSEVKSTSGIIFTAVMLPETGGFFIVQGYAPKELGIQRFNLVEGKNLSSNHQMIIGRMMADSLNKKVGDTIELSGIRYRIVGIYESKAAWEEMGGVITLRDAQTLTGRPRKVTMLAIKVNDSRQAEQLVQRINQEFPEIHAALAGDFVDQMPDMQSADGMMAGMSLLAIIVGGVGVLNTMLMAVFERTREIGVLRALGWRRRAILGMILNEALTLGFLGGIAGIGLAFLLTILLQKAPMYGAALIPAWDLDIFIRAILVALSLGLVGGLYPAYRATRLQPIEALRYE